jgi:hypothetical protein
MLARIIMPHRVMVKVWQIRDIWVTNWYYYARGFWQTIKSMLISDRELTRKIGDYPLLLLFHLRVIAVSRLRLLVRYT